MDVVVLARQIGMWVRKRRVALGMTQRELAAKSHVSERLVRDLEAGTATGIGLEKLVSVLNVLGMRLAIDHEATPMAADDGRGEAYTALLEQAMRSWDGMGGEEK